jgi:CBS domain-containing protein
MPEEAERYISVRDVMTTSVITATPETPLLSIAETMMERHVRAIPVIDESGHVLGIVTDRSVMSQFLPRLETRDPAAGELDLAGPRGVAVREVMDRSVMCVNDDQPLADVAALMLDKEMERLPVVAEGVLVGFLTRGDIIRTLLARLSGETVEQTDPAQDEGE